MDNSNGRVQISVIIDAIKKAYPDFDVRTYGYKKAPDFFKGEFDFLNVHETKENIFVAETKTYHASKEKADEKVINIVKKSKGQKINMSVLSKKAKVDYELFGYSRFKKYLETIKELEINGTDVKIKK